MIASIDVVRVNEKLKVQDLSSSDMIGCWSPCKMQWMSRVESRDQDTLHFRDNSSKSERATLVCRNRLADWTLGPPGTMFMFFLLIYWAVLAHPSSRPFYDSPSSIGYDPWHTSVSVGVHPDCSLSGPLSNLDKVLVSISLSTPYYSVCCFFPCTFSFHNSVRIIDFQSTFSDKCRSAPRSRVPLTGSSSIMQRGRTQSRTRYNSSIQSIQDNDGE